MGGSVTEDINRARKNYAQQATTKPFPHQINLTRHKDKIPHLLNDPIIFTEDESRDLWHPHKDTIVVTLRITGRNVYRILVDNGSSADILFKSTLNGMNMIGAKIEPTASSLSGFTGDSVSSEGILNLPIEFGTSPYQHIRSINFVIANYPTLYNSIIGCSTHNQIRAVTSTYQLLVTFPMVRGIGVLKGNQLESQEIYETTNRSANVQGIRNLVKSCDKTLTTNTSEENKLANAQENSNSVRNYMVNVLHYGDGVHDTTDPHSTNYIHNFN